MSQVEEAVTAELLMDRLQEEAKRLGDDRPVATLARVVEACDEILSGAAVRRAKAAKEDWRIFDPDFVKLTPRVIGLYVRLRARLDKGQTTWTGPHPTTIRGWQELAEYVRLRAAEAHRPGRPKRPAASSRKADEIVDGIENLHDRAQLREVVAKGREAKRQLDIMTEALRKYPEIDIEALREGRSFATKVQGPQAQSAIGPGDVKLIRRLVSRLQNKDELKEFDQLVYSGGRVKQEDGLDLVPPEEMRLLERLAGLEGMGATGT